MLCFFNKLNRWRLGKIAFEPFFTMVHPNSAISTFKTWSIQEHAVLFYWAIAQNITGTQLKIMCIHVEIRAEIPERNQVTTHYFWEDPYMKNHTWTICKKI
jgi:hypothetical protein